MLIDIAGTGKKHNYLKIIGGKAPGLNISVFFELNSPGLKSNQVFPELPAICRNG
jgi:hypothetical protein